MYYNDSCECNHLQMKSILGNIEDRSREERKFLGILETGTKKDGAHYEVPHLYPSGILIFNSLTTETKLLKECIICKEVH